MIGLCNDTFFVIFEYLNLQDYLILRSSCRYFRDLVNDLTFFADMMEFMQNEKIDFRERNKLFYKCCSQKIEIARFIYQKTNLDIFLFTDIFALKLCDRNDVELIRNVISIRGIDISQYDMLRDENYFDFLKEVEELVEGIRIVTPQSINEVFIHYCSGFFDRNLNKIKAFYLFGNFSKFGINIAINACFMRKSYDFLKYILSVIRLDEEKIDSLFQNLCINNYLEDIKFFMENVNVSNRILMKGLKGSLVMKNIEIAKYLLEIINLDEENMRELFIFSCKIDNSELVSFFIDKVQKEDINNGFIFACENKCRNVAYMLYSLNVLDNETKQHGFLVCCLSTNIEIAKLLITTNYIDKKTIANSFRELCLNDDVNSVSWLLYYANIDIEVVNSTLMECCMKNSHSIIRYLIRYFTKIPSDVLKECFLYCLNNRRYRILNLFARKYDPNVIDYVKRNNSNSKLMEIFEDACLADEMDGVRWISNMIKIKSDFVNKIIVKCFEKDCYEVNKYLICNYTITDENLHNCFLICCNFGYNISIRVLIDLIKNETIINKGFVLCCKNGHFAIFDLLYRMYKIDIFYNNSEAFHQSCINGHRKIYKILKAIMSNNY